MSKSKEKNRITRREVLKGMAVAGAAASVPGWLAACTADAPELRTGPLQPDEVPLDTIVVVMMENRSFDHYFGTLSLDEGRTDIDGLKPNMFNPDTLGNKVPINLVTPDRICVLDDPDHEWDAWPVQFDGGKNDGFVKAHIARHGFAPDTNKTVMTYYQRKQLPFLHGLADDYTLCQRSFCA